MLFDWVFYLPVIAIVVVIVAMSVRILREYERGVVFTLGRFSGVKGPGLILLLPYVQQMVRVDQRTLVLDVPTQDVISRDNVSVKVNAVIYFRVVDAGKSVIQVENFRQATSELAQTTLRSVLGKHQLDEMLSERDKLNNDIQDILDAQTDAWGIKVSNVEIKHIDLGESMVRVIARQAEAERERRAKVINAEGEEQAARKLLEAAEILANRPEAMQLRYLGTLNTLGLQNNTTILFPFPLEFGRLLSGLAGAPGGDPAPGSEPAGGATRDHG
jgi:regulator of protease activity HflC (stomatin/prohibitin superfamily)